jgi:uncharacterized membrane protein YkoI
MSRWTWLLAVALAAGAVPTWTTSAQADEKNEHEHTPTSLDKIPAPARAALLREAAGAPMIDVVTETENGQTVYEAHVKKGNDVIGIEVDAKGNVLKRESEKGEKSEKKR